MEVVPGTTDLANTGIPSAIDVTGTVSPVAHASGSWLEDRIYLIAYGVTAGFSVYFCMYAFRKPFDAVTFDGMQFLGSMIQLKTACVIAQIIGYTLSKYLGSRFVSEVSGGGRARLLIGAIGVAEVGLLLFAVLPNDLKPAAMLLNGLPLGMVWGLVVRYLEGRRSSEILVAGLSCSFIIAGAMTRDVGRDLVMTRWQVTEAWMPAITGALFIVPLLLAVWMLNGMPPPSPEDVAARAPRQPMRAAERRAFLAHFGAGLWLLLTAYFLLTALRDFRDHFSAEIFTSLGLARQTAIFSRTEQWAMFAVILAMAGLNLFSDHRRALTATFAVIVLGLMIIGLASLAFHLKACSGFAWMAWVGVGMYMAYVPFGAILFERMMACSRLAGTSVFAILLADGIGYTGSVIVLMIRDLLFGEGDRLSFFLPFSLIVSSVGGVLMAWSAIVTLRRSGKTSVSA